MPERPDLQAFRESTPQPFREIVTDLVPLLGRKLTAYIGGERRPRRRPMDRGPGTL